MECRRCGASREGTVQKGGVLQVSGAAGCRLQAAGCSARCTARVRVQQDPDGGGEMDTAT